MSGASSHQSELVGARRRTSGYRSRRVREAQSLPLSWRYLTKVDLEQLQVVLADTSGDKKASLLTLESCLLLWSMLVTGRTADQLLGLAIRRAPSNETLEMQVPGLTVSRERWGWWLVAGAPRDQKLPEEGDFRSWSPLVYLPAADQIVELATRCIAERNRASAGRVHLTSEPIPLFTHGAQLLPVVETMLRSRNPIAHDRARRATTTPEAVARWLPAELTNMAGGDVVPAAVITARVDGGSRTAIYYGSISCHEAIRTYNAALGSAGRLTHTETPAQLTSRFVGDRRTPTDTAVRTLIARLAADLDRVDVDLAERHRAMMHYTVALLSFALAHRGISGSMPKVVEVHAESRFCWIRDKTISGEMSRRLVWICDTAFDQLKHYESHLDTLSTMVSPAAAATIRSLRVNRSLPLFDLSRGPVEPLSLSSALGEALKPLPKNAGRHWLRSRLVGRCSADALQALYGHGPSADGSWDQHSTLDPAIYRADLAAALDPALAEIGWQPRSSCLSGNAA